MTLATTDAFNPRRISQDLTAHLPAARSPTTVAIPDESDTDSGAESWAPVDLGPILDGTYVAPQATIGRRDDGVAMFYPGRIHSVFAEPEAGKTWLMVLASAGELRCGNDVLYIDFEDAPEGIVPRLLAVGASPQSIRDHFHYIRPSGSPGLIGTALLTEAITPSTTLATIDGVTEAMSIYGLKTKDDTDVAAFWRRLPRLIANRGPAAVLLDHVVKDRESRGRWATGSQHKLSGLNGSAFTLEAVHPFGIGMKGRSRLLVTKDRPAQVRRHAVQSKVGSWFADMVVDSKPDGSVLANLYPPVDREEGPFRPTSIMKAVSAVLVKAGQPLGFRDIKSRVEGKDEYIRRALALLEDEGHLTTSPGARGATLHELVKPFGADD